MRVKSEIWVKAYLRRVMSVGAAVYVTRSGDASAGAVFIHVDDLAGAHRLFVPAPAGLDEASDERRWIAGLGGAVASAEQVGDYLRQQVKYDPDLWLIEVEDKDGRHFLGDELVDIAR